MPTLLRFLAVLGTIAGVIAGSLYVLAEHFQPEPKQISKALRNLKAEPRPVSPNSPAAEEPSLAPPPSHRAQ